MLSTSKALMASKVRVSYGRSAARRTWLATLVLALASAVVAGPVFARTVFDGDWSVLIVTHGGACDPAFDNEFEELERQFAELRLTFDHN